MSNPKSKSTTISELKSARIRKKEEKALGIMAAIGLTAVLIVLLVRERD